MVYELGSKPLILDEAEVKTFVNSWPEACLGIATTLIRYDPEVVAYFSDGKIRVQTEDPAWIGKTTQLVFESYLSVRPTWKVPELFVVTVKIQCSTLDKSDACSQSSSRYEELLAQLR